jgi:integrase
MATRIVEDTVKSAPIPAIRSATHWDTDIVGFGFRVHVTGAKSFFLNYWVNGRERRVTIGKWPAWSALRARNRAKELRREVDTGGDPARERRERREAATIGELIERYRRDHLPTRRNVRKDDREGIPAIIADALGLDTKVASIHSGDVEAMHRAITETNGPVRANRVLAAASKMFALSLRPLAGEDKAWRTPDLGNPCKGVIRNHEEAKGRLYTAAQLEAIGEALVVYPGRIAADCVTLVMLTGCRPAEAKKARWSEFDAEPGYWNKPSSHTKQKRTHRVPLSPPARQLVERLRTERTGDVVFPGRTVDGAVDALQHCWRFVRDHADLDEDARLYDLRHSFASLGAGGGLSLPVIGRLLGHSTAKTTERYARHLADDPLQAAVDKIASKMSGTDLTTIGRRP